MSASNVITPETLANKTILVTGGAGFIGSWLTKALVQQFTNTTIINLDALTYAGNLDNLAEIANAKNYQFVHGNILDRNLVDELMSKADYCIHTAAQTHVDRSIDDSYDFVETNVLGTQVLLNAAKKHQLKKFVLVSTDEVYGALSLEDESVFTEDSPLQPNNPYSASKAGGDLLALSYAKTHGLPLCITRCGNNYGPYQYPEKLIPFFLSKLQQQQQVPVYGDGLHVRDWIYVADHAQAIIQVLLGGQMGHVYNISAGTEQNNLSVVKQLIQLFGHSSPDEHIKFVPDRPGHDRRYALKADKIKALGWRPQVLNFDDGLRQTVEWYHKNPDWVSRVQERQQSGNTPQAAQWLASC